MAAQLDPVVLTVRGTLVPASLEAARVLHNDTAGSEQGIAAARSLGDLSHKVFAPASRATKLSSAREPCQPEIDQPTNNPGGHRRSCARSRCA